MKKKSVLIISVILAVIIVGLSVFLIVNRQGKAKNGDETESSVETKKTEETEETDKAPLSYSYTDIVNRLTDTKYLSIGGTGEKSLLASSYDRASTEKNGEYYNWRANNDGVYSEGNTTDGGMILADIKGAGYISRIWSANPGPGHVKIYIDGETEPTFDYSFTDYFSGNIYPFIYKNLVYNDSANAANIYLPITFSESCRVVAYGGSSDDGWGTYYQINYTLFPDGTIVERMPKEFSDSQLKALENANAALGNMGENPNGEDGAFETAEVTKDTPYIKTLTGKGAISGLLVRVDSLKDEYAISQKSVEALKNLRIKIWWDGEETPSVNAPLGDFFSSGYGFDEVQMLLLGKRDDRTFYNYFYMPYLTGAKIEIYTVGDESETISVALNITENTCSESEMMYFGAQFTLGYYHEDALDDEGNYDENAERSPDYHFLTINGRGRLVGLSLHQNKITDGVDPVSYPGYPWWGEGDEKFFVDGESFPSWFGTGTEDFFGYGWCSATWFNKAYHTQSYCEGDINGVGSRVNSRLLLCDSIAFEMGFEGYLEKYYTDDYTKYGITSYFYLAKGSTVENTDYEDDKPLDYYKPKSEGGYFIEGEDLYVNRYLPESGEVISASASHIDRQPMDSFGTGYSGNSQITAFGLGASGSIEYSLPVPESGKYMILASFINAPDYSIFKVSVNGETLGGAIDGYSPAVSFSALYELGEVTLSAGYDNTLMLTNMGGNQSMVGNLYLCAIDFVILIPADSYPGISEFDLSAYTDVTRVLKKSDESIQVYLYFEGETDLFGSAKNNGGSPIQQYIDGLGWSGNGQLFLYSTDQNTELTVTVTVPEDGSYLIEGVFTTASDYGRYSVSVNGGDIGAEMDFYSAGVALSSQSLGKVVLKKGANQVKFTCVGKNTASSGYCLGIDYLRLTSENQTD